MSPPLSIIDLNSESLMKESYMLNMNDLSVVFLPKIHGKVCRLIMMT